MFLYQFDKSYILAKYDTRTGVLEDFIDVGMGPENFASGCFYETAEGYVAVYGQNGNLYFQSDQKRWDITDVKLKYTFLSGGAVCRVNFKIEDEQSLFEIAYKHWTENALVSDLDDDDAEHDFFAYLIWLRDTRAESAAKRWSENNHKDLSGLEVS